MSDRQFVNTEPASFLFGPGFLRDHLGQIIGKPDVAVLELVANCYDAGADKLTIVWPQLRDQILSITDNGTGMTRKEFEHRWKTLSYDAPPNRAQRLHFHLVYDRQKERLLGTMVRVGSAHSVSRTNTKLRRGKTASARRL